MKKNLKYLLNVLLLILIVALTLWFLLRNQEMSKIMEYIRAAKSGYLIAAVAMVCIFVCSESVIMRFLFGNFKINMGIVKCIMLSSIGFFFSAITPGASGGQPVQVYYMTKYGVDMLVSTLMAMVITVFYKLALLFLCGLFFIIETETMMEGVSAVPLLFAYGFIGNALFMAFLCLIVLKPKVAFNIISALIRFGGKIRLIKHPDRILRKAVKSIRQYEKCSSYLKSNMSVVPVIMIITLIQRIVYFSIAYMVYRSFGLSGAGFTEIVALQIVLSLAVDVLPLPGAAGANESVYIVLYGKIFGELAVFSGMLLSRGITYYAMLILTAVGTAFAHVYFTRHAGSIVSGRGFRLKRIRLYACYRKRSDLIKKSRTRIKRLRSKRQKRKRKKGQG